MRISETLSPVATVGNYLCCRALTSDDTLRLIFGQVVAVIGFIELAGFLHQVNIFKLLRVEGLQVRNPE